ncbi:hypothetical protein L3Q65_18040 [Amycolatopsis sp. FU40]|uniref:hypothetical protein n=1 Tax=Amycolatopsis sp. FU40 TaxID=2914159 RepID=UPI001F407449|nr:hypothetical protein [Amycolatopsis sp. FU40]UKD58539.1 hypothetical protein L3Q65_18040 [Amycolatopsis sp. FU40]
MAVGLRAVAVAGLADVPALANVGAQPAPGLLQGVEDLVFGDRLVDPALEDSLRAAAGDGDRLVGSEQRDVRLLELTFDRQSFERPSSYPGDALADHDVEPTIRTLCFLQQVRDAAIACDGNVEPLVARLLPAIFQRHPPGFDVVEMGDDHPCPGQGVLGVSELADQRLPRVLLIVGRSTPEERHPNLALEQRCRHA